MFGVSHEHCTLRFAVDKNGEVCISILHDPGEDKYGYERPEERWLPIHTVSTIMMSVISMLADPNDESPANIDAAVSAPAVFVKHLEGEGGAGVETFKSWCVAA